MELNSVNLTPVQKRKIYLNPLRNPISDLRQLNALKDEDIKASKQRSMKKSVNPLLNPVSNLSEWRDLLAKDTKSVCNVHEWSVSTTEDTNRSMINGHAGCSRLILSLKIQVSTSLIR
ncbi:hypothetical protein GQ457_18G021390 [Hibiscus cannabinus]